jgi:hypothetical protein
MKFYLKQLKQQKVMKKQIMILALATGIVANGLGQPTTIDGGAVSGNPINFLFPGLSKLETVGGLISQNKFLVTSLTDTRATGSFATNAEWNSMGSFELIGTSPTRTFSGFRSQSKGRGLYLGFTYDGNDPSSNPFIQWSGANPPSSGINPGNLDFRLAYDPISSGANIPPSTVFSLQPAGNPTDQEANVLATNKSILGHLQVGNFGDISGNARWIGIGAARIGGVLNDNNYGLRVQRDGNSYIANLTNNGEAVTGWGPGNDMYHRFFPSNTNPSLFVNVVKYRPNGCIEMGDNISSFSFDPKLKLNGEEFRTGLAIETKAGTGIEMLVKDRPGIDLTVVRGTDRQGEAYGLWTKVSGADAQNFGVNAVAEDNVVFNNIGFKNNFGVRAVGLFGTASFGIDAFADRAQYLNFAVYGRQGNTNSLAFNAAGYFDGETYCSSGFWTGSDKRLKKDIQAEKNALGIVQRLNPVNYFLNQADNSWINLTDKKQHGFISQEVAEILPELVQDVKHPVRENNRVVRYESYKALNYNGFISLLTKAIQELNNKVEALETQLSQKTSSQVVVINEATDAITEKIKASSFMLAQNVPNPFTSSTIIKYSIPANNVAMIAVFDLNGKMLLQFPNLKGANQITINGSTLQAGMYLYSLLVNGQEIITKKMVLTK